MSWPQAARASVSALGVIAAISLATNGYLLLKDPEGPVIVTPEQMIDLARTNFPAEYASTTDPENQALAFVINAKRRVQHKAIVLTGANEPLQSTLAQAFPSVAFGAKASMGSACFTAEAGSHGKFCVIYVVPDAL